jgi:hypothetical protein
MFRGSVEIVVYFYAHRFMVTLVKVYTIKARKPVNGRPLTWITISRKYIIEKDLFQKRAYISASARKYAYGIILLQKHITYLNMVNLTQNRRIYDAMNTDRLCGNHKWRPSSMVAFSFENFKNSI